METYMDACVCSRGTCACKERLRKNGYTDGGTRGAAIVRVSVQSAETGNAFCKRSRGNFACRFTGAALCIACPRFPHATTRARLCLCLDALARRADDVRLWVSRRLTVLSLAQLTPERPEVVLQILRVLWLLMYWSLASKVACNSAVTKGCDAASGYKSNGSPLFEREEDVARREAAIKAAFGSCSCKTGCTARCSCSKRGRLCVGCKCDPATCTNSGNIAAAGVDAPPVQAFDPAEIQGGEEESEGDDEEDEDEEGGGEGGGGGLGAHDWPYDLDGGSSSSEEDGNEQGWKW